MEKTIDVTVVGAGLVSLDKLEPFQGELKRLDRQRYEELRKNILDNGFSFTIHVWKKDGKNYIIDGHQRCFTLKQMREVEGYKIPPLPISIVEAESYEAAKRKILAGSAQYGLMTEESLANFLKENDIPFDEVVATFHFPEIDMDKFSGMFADLAVLEPVLPEIAPPEALPEMRSSSVGVKQVQLFFSSDAHAEFMSKLSELAKALGKENISDAILEIIREAHTARFDSKH